MKQILERVQQGTKKITLGNGKQLAWNEWGKPNGFPMLHFHGANNCRMEGIVMDDVCKNNDIRLISVDRPGCGESTFPSDKNIAKQYNFDSYMKDVTQLLTHLEIENNRFGILGISQGATFTMAGLRYFPQLSYCPQLAVLWVGLPLTEKYLLENDDRYKTVIPKEIRQMFEKSDTMQISLLMELQRFAILNATDFFVNSMIKSYLDSNDANAMNSKLDGYNDVTVKQWFGENMKMSVKHGAQGMKWALKITSNDNWNFDLKDIPNDPRIFMFYGKTDKLVPWQWGQLYFEHLTTNCGLNNVFFKAFEDSGHFTALPLVNQEFSKIKNYIDQLQDK